MKKMKNKVIMILREKKKLGIMREPIITLGSSFLLRPNLPSRKHVAILQEYKQEKIEYQEYQYRVRCLGQKRNHCTKENHGKIHFGVMIHYTLYRITIIAMYASKI
jgi:hypothetical protein